MTTRIPIVQGISDKYVTTKTKCDDIVYSLIDPIHSIVVTNRVRTQFYVFGSIPISFDIPAVVG